MLNIKELEKRWKRYKFKQYLPLMVIIFIVLFAGGIYISKNIDKMLNQEEVKEQKKEIKTDKVKKEIKDKTPKNIVTKQAVEQKIEEVNYYKVKSNEKKQTIAKKEETVKKVKIQETKKEDTPKIKKEKDVVLKPSINFLKAFESSKKETNNIQNKIKPKIKENKQINKEHKQKPKVFINKMEEKKEKENQKVKISIKKVNEKEIQDIIKRFKKTNNPVLSLFVAKKYYEMGEYSKSYNYALITNEIDSTIEDSWLIFAKSLVKLGKKDKAIKSLKAYIKTSNSNKAVILLNNIQLGKFR